MRHRSSLALGACPLVWVAFQAGTSAAPASAGSAGKVAGSTRAVRVEGYSVTVKCTGHANASTRSSSWPANRTR
jgi:hypothetical protein